MNFLAVGFGGMLGSLTRYGLGKFITRKSKSSFYWGTFIINISGAFLLGIVNSLNLDKVLLLLLADGFLGAYTTFSTFMYEGFHLFKDNHKLNAVIYILASLLLGLAGYFAGRYLCVLY